MDSSSDLPSRAAGIIWQDWSLGLRCYDGREKLCPFEEIGFVAALRVRGIDTREHSANFTPEACTTLPTS
jgi:hypothetical protein